MKWIFLQSTGYVTGFYYENPRWPTSLTSLGIVSDGLHLKVPPLTPQYYDSPDWPLIATPTHLYVSIANFVGLKTVHLCRVGNRCTGMLIHYVVGPTVVLGQWHSLYIAEHSCIYSGDGLAITNVCFRTSKSRQYQVVTNIEFSKESDEAVQDPNLQVFKVQMVRYFV
jgi:hypothetical protein